MEYVPKHTTENVVCIVRSIFMVLMVKSWWFVMAFFIIFDSLVMVLEFSCYGSIVFFSMVASLFLYNAF